MFATLFVDDRDVLVQPELREVVRGAPLSPDAFTGWDEGTVHFFVFSYIFFRKKKRKKDYPSIGFRG